MYLPKFTQNLILDIVDGKKSGRVGEYNVTTYPLDSLSVFDMGIVSKQQISQSILPRLQKEVDLNFDYNDVTSVMREVLNLKILKTLVSGLTKEN